ncbi:MAG: bifunctional demethylmenaquinone methyltransferase/2-methoxy-6-polyprenyl,4-benzoquinol methylase [Gammaproteobacteria bacterium]|jgi:demethylmenaquinone methyltransferase/2-methoxy-6-polyprenyl-1,4-benzoquinol methylase|nr:bifunctional demethylmenaquinone methyltransferase/2-methoxy-6-polyprenyl,4-benzoquinol methylase [Gammaproteobacteria bacterium]
MTKLTDFGFQQVPWQDKAKHVRDVFNSVAPKYDLMNDLMSLGLHRVWKRIAVALADVRPHDRILDLAGGTADLTRLMAPKISQPGEIILADINDEMLKVGRDKLINEGLWQKVKVIQANAECLPFPENYFNVVTIAFGLRNVTDKNAALQEMYRVLKPGGQILILEFSEVKQPFLKSVYDAYSFHILPKLGDWVASDAASYQYLAESIRKHPNQATLLQMMEAVGFEQCKVNNFLAGIVALHRGFKF